MPRFHWDTLPAVRLLLPLVLGIYGASQLLDTVPFGNWQWLLLLACLVLMYLWRFHKPLARIRQHEWVFGLSATLALFIFGLLNTTWHTERLRPDHFTHQATDSSYLLIRLIEQPAQKTNGYKALAEVLAIADDPDSLYQASGKIMTFIKPDTLLPLPNYGDCLLMKDPRPLQPAPNPYEFDYSTYLRRQNVEAQAFLTSLNCTPTGINQGNAFYKIIYQIRDYCLDVIRFNVAGDEERAVASALLLGYTHLLDDDIMQAYSHTGAMHILSVSGLHVGIIWGILQLVFSFLDKRGKRGQYAKTALILTLIWLYAFVTALSPSIFRAVLMFTGISLARLWRVQPQAYNIMASSAFIILLADPYALYNVGFQLSYTALLGIVAIQPYLRQLFLPPNKISLHAWELINTSVAAQIGTLPLSFLYFHQFPLYFLLTNLIAIPLSTIVLWVGIALLVFSPIDYFAQLLGTLLSYSIYGLDAILYAIHALPYAVSRIFAFGWVEVWVAYLAIILLTLFFVQRKTPYLLYGMSLLLFMATLNCIYQARFLGQRSLLVFNLKNATGIAFVEGNKALLLAQSIDEKTEKKQLRRLLPYQNNKGIRQLTQANLQQRDTLQMVAEQFSRSIRINEPFVQFYDKKILLFDTLAAQYQATNDIETDYLLLCQNPRINLQGLQECIHFKHVIMDGSNSQWRVDKWAKECETIGIPYSNVKNGNAFVLDF